MNTVPLTPEAHEAVVRQATELLRRGGVLIVPTDTVYGLAADATNIGAVKKVFAIKERSRLKALPVFVADIVAASHAAVFPTKAISLLKELWPGQTTVVFRKREAIPDVVTGGGRTMGLRVPDYLFLNRLLERYPHPLTATSANLSGLEPADSAAAVRQMFRQAKYIPDLLVDAGTLPPSPPSTVLDLTDPEHPRILRMGAITKEQLDTILSQWRIGSKEGSDTISGK